MFLVCLLSFLLGGGWGMAKMLIGLKKNLRASRAFCQVSSTITFLPPLLRFPANAFYVLLFNLKLQKTGIKSVLWVYTIWLMIEFGKGKFLKYPSSLLYSFQTDLIRRRMIEKIQGIYCHQVIQIRCRVHIISYNL